MIAASLCLFGMATSVVPASGHELLLKANSEIRGGEPLEMIVHSSHRFIVPEEMEDVSRVKAGLLVDGKAKYYDIRGMEKETRIDFTVPAADVDTSKAVILVATKDGEPWSSTNEGSMAGTRRELEAKGLKVLRTTKYDKFVKEILNASASDTSFTAEAGFPLEITPVTNPANAKVGEYFDVRITNDGQPFTGPVWATYDGFAPELTSTYAYYTEAENGLARIKITAPGLWGVRAVADRAGVEGEYDALSLRSFLMFEVK